jgi:hypothetical protein
MKATRMLSSPRLVRSPGIRGMEMKIMDVPFAQHLLLRLSHRAI